ncbi:MULTISPECIES: diaminobutyrate acetyltransferase [Streptomyces]|uniref:L-2,4-diaminobutyric acid acetyltransferase n=1 Tax=Streptomyces clavifer TaxID=68188 RepID=A0ABS4VH78_9ACTN|nr:MULTISPECIES: diaminobutyrate acetyltransferase [Streptomyces]KQZ18805.1 2,4-diaminobutyric acid acetyltransferase [Streptomyces sp. Root55]MBP2363292.1 L-2,4-diaminobutyric acid acetyltransferase [Streptomyces clavifer]MDX2747025.1 diaminobutyrate acetyltransferase [Streptomyces sp. NRRL_B-2557]MDX3067570.1 diaminobutyrate acetyltransferase [Streptomyces sp. ND04-05B]RPK72145.1 L-2,4-diaminobutyric acid acetyltransferase [Streptomyces sp. ADI97-07]
MVRAAECMEEPTIEDGAAAWRIARDSRVLDVNSSYSYVLWCRDFAATSVVTRDEKGQAVAFATGYIRPEVPGTLVIWQIAVDEHWRGRGLAGSMLDHLADRLLSRGVLQCLETTIGARNEASQRLFLAFAERHGAQLERELLFPAHMFPDAHEPEYLHRIGPLIRPFVPPLGTQHSDTRHTRSAS